MKRSFLIFLQCILFFSLSAKDSGYSIRNYTPKEYGGFNQVWCSVQDKDGVLYFGTSTNIFAYDGRNWTAIPVVTGNPIRSMCLGEDGTIYVGSYGSFGYLEKQISGKQLYRELSNQLPAAQKKFTDVWRVYISKGEIIFQASEGVYFFKDHKYTASLLPKNTFALSFLCGGHLYIRHRQVGIQEIVDHQLKSVPGGELFADERCLDIIPWKAGEFALLTGDSGFYAFSPSGGKGFRRQRLPCDQYLHDCFVLGAKFIDDSTIAIYSRIGLGFIDRKGNLRDALTTEDGLIDNSVSSILTDREGQLWLTTGNGISHVFYHNTARYYRNRKSGYEGDVNNVIDYKDHIYLATTAGLYKSVAPGNAKTNAFELIGFAQTELWSMAIADGDLLVGSSGGAFIYKDEKNVEYLNDRFTRDIALSKDSSCIFTAEMGGVRMLKKQNGKWQTTGFAEIPGEQQSLLIVQYKFNGGQRVWSIGQSGRLYRVDFTDKGNTVRSYSTEAGIDDNVSMFFIIGDSICAKTAEQVYIYRPALDKGENTLCFFPSPAMNKIISDRNTNINFTCTPKGKLIRSSKLEHNFSVRRYGFFRKNKKTGLYDSQFLDLAECSPDDFIFSYVDSHDNFWVSFAGMVIHFDMHLPVQKIVPFQTMITQVVVGKDSLLFSGVCSSNPVPVNLKYKDNNIVFRFAAPTFNHEELTTYNFYLEGFDKKDDTTRFAAASEKGYTNLPEGDYAFVVRSLNSLGDEGTIARFEFTILPPWYRTIWAYCIYFVVFVSTIYLSIRISANRLRKQKERLEVIIAERTAEVVAQNHRIESQNVELESAYKGIQDSIHYAERIQHAILPVTTEIHNSFPDSFVFFRPRDIVSGDFYWLVKRGNLTWIACVDCTGHGVPGAFMSMIGNTLLNEIVLEKKIEAPNKILDLLHIRVRQALRQDAGGETRDGMDISLCLIDAEKRKLTHAGANRALWIIRNGELIVLPPDKFSIGGDQWDEQRHFTIRETDLTNGDCIYMSSDGYADQFGGPKGKKFMVKRFQQLLLDISQLPMEEQGKRIEKTFDDWKSWTDTDGKVKKLEQVDDVLVIGFRVN